MVQSRCIGGVLAVFLAAACTNAAKPAENSAEASPASADAATEARAAFSEEGRAALDDLLANLTGIAVGALAGFLLTRRDRTKTPGLANETGR